VEAYFYLKLKERKIKSIHHGRYCKDNQTRFDFYLPDYNMYIEVTGYNKEELKSVRWFSYLRNIVKKKRYVEIVLKAKFMFVKVKLQKYIFIKVRKHLR